MTPVDRLAALQKREIAAAAAAGEAFFLDLPDAWYEPQPTYGCENGHVSHRYLKSEQRGIVCLACGKPIAMLPGHYTDESLTAALAKEGEQEAHPSVQQSSDGVVAQGSPVGYEPSRADYVKVARTFALAYGLHQDAPEYLPRTREAADDFEPHGWVIAALMQAYADGKWQGSSAATSLADGQAANCTLAKDTEATENVQNLKKALLILESIISPAIDDEDERGLERAMLRVTRRAVDECADLISRSIAGLQVTPNEWERMLSKLRGVQGATQSAVEKKRGGVNG